MAKFASDAQRKAVFANMQAGGKYSAKKSGGGGSVAKPTKIKAKIGKEEAGLKSFASDIHEVVDIAPKTGAFKDKVWISDAFRVYKFSGGDMDRKQFNANLLKANRKGLLRLGQEDLPDKHPSATVKSSSVSLGPATFHYVRSK